MESIVIDFLPFYRGIHMGVALVTLGMVGEGDAMEPPNSLDLVVHGESCFLVFHNESCFLVFHNESCLI